MARITVKTLGVTCLLLVAGVIPLAVAKDPVTYEKDVRPIIAAKCSICHGAKSPTDEEFKKDRESFKKKLKGPRMDTYQNLMIFVKGDDTGALMRRLDDGKNTKDGQPGNMYRYLGADDAEKAKNLAVIKEWVGGWTLKRNAEITEAELKAIKALEK